jgi:multicomponent Na+:H+ antiporter subunit D
VTSAAGLSVLLPLAGGLACVLLRNRAALATAAATAAATMVAATVVAAHVWREGAGRYPLGDWRAPLGIDLYADGLSAILLLMTGMACIGIGIYASASLGPWSGARRRADAFWPLSLFLWAALNALFLSADLFNVYVCLELLTLAAIALVVLEEDRVALFAAMRYLLAAFLGSMVFLLGVALLYAMFGVLDLETLAGRMTAGPAAWAGVALITGGLALKTALFPLHFWLPRAHASALPPVSALLSALVVTGSYYLVLRLWLGVFPAALGPEGARLLGVLGAAAIVWGSLQAIRQQHLKLLIAYSTVAQVGYLFLLVPLVGPVAGGAAPWAHAAWTGGVYHAVSHGFAKAAMFLAAGNIVRALGSDRILGISGIASNLPISTYAFGIAGMSLIGLPPSGGFVAKWQMLSAAFGSGQWWWGIVILAGGLLTAGYVFLVLGQELSRADEDTTPEFAPVPRTMEWSAFALALVAFLLGLRAIEPMALLDVGSPFPLPGAR